MSIINYFLHLDSNLLLAASKYGVWIYLILFSVVFVETGIFFFPFLPGDSLLFVAGSLSAFGTINSYITFFTLICAAILGDSVNYTLGKFFGRKIIDSGRVNSKFISKTEKFYSKYGKNTIMLARFVPIVRTFAPFMAGIGRMRYNSFLVYNVIGAILWVTLFFSLGFFFGNIPFVKNNLLVFVVGIVVLSLIPLLIELIKIRKL